MNKTEIKTGTIITLIAIAISPFIILLICLFNFQNWQDGYSVDEWLYAGLEECDIEYEEILFLNYEVLDDEQYDYVITYQYELKSYELKDKNSMKDIDVYYGNIKRTYISMTFTFDGNFWNKLNRFLTTNYKTQKYTNCIDFDIFEEVENE